MYICNHLLDDHRASFHFFCRVTYFYMYLQSVYYAQLEVQGIKVLINKWLSL